VINDVLYVVCRKSPIIKAYTADTLSPVGDYYIFGMTDPEDIAACQNDRQLYVLSYESIWRVSTDRRGQYEDWVTAPSPGFTRRISATSQHLTVTAQPCSLHQYNRTNRLLRVIQLPDYVTFVWHAAETKHDTVVVAYEVNKERNAVSIVRVSLDKKYAIVPTSSTGACRGCCTPSCTGSTYLSESHHTSSESSSSAASTVELHSI